MLNNTLQRLSFLKVLIDEESKTATGIQVSRFGQTLTLSAKKEVILSKLWNTKLLRQMTMARQIGPILRM